MTVLHERLTHAFEELLAANRPSFGGGGLGYYGVRLENVAADGSELDVVLTFRAGTRYCCCEAGCHFAHYCKDGWAKLRVCMDHCGLRDQPLPAIRRFRGVIEEVTVFNARDDFQSPGALRSQGTFEYEAGPWFPQ